MRGLDRLADDPGFLLAVPHPDNRGTLAQRRVREQRLSQPASIVRDESGGDRKDMPAGTVIALKSDDFRSGKVFLESQDVVHVRPAPAVDRLIVVADAAKIAVGLSEKA